MANDQDEAVKGSRDEDDALDGVEAESGVAVERDDAVDDEATESLRELVTYLVNSLVDEPESVEIDVTRRGPAVHIQLRLPESELGKVIGRGGRIAKAIRTVLLIAGSKHHLRVSLDIEG